MCIRNNIKNIFDNMSFYFILACGSIPMLSMSAIVRKCESVDESPILKWQSP